MYELCTDNIKFCDIKFFKRDYYHRECRSVNFSFIKSSLMHADHSGIIEIIENDKRAERMKRVIFSC